MRVFKSLSLPRIVTFTANGGSSFPLSPINMLELTLPANEGGRVVTAQSRSGRLPRNPKHDFCIRWYFTEGPWGSKQQPPSTRSTPDQCCVFQKHYSGFGSFETHAFQWLTLLLLASGLWRTSLQLLAHAMAVHKQGESVCTAFSLENNICFWD